jgi:predicted lactoylglutathione lyase
MEPKFIWANLASNDLERTTQFYTTLGFESNGKIDEGTRFFFGQNKFDIIFFY